MSEKTDDPEDALSWGLDTAKARAGVVDRVAPTQITITRAGMYSIDAVPWVWSTRHRRRVPTGIYEFGPGDVLRLAWLGQYFRVAYVGAPT